MPYFPTSNDLYRVIQRELPEGVYADGPPSAFFTTASVFAKAQEIASLYSDLELIYINEFPQSTVDRINDWEIKLFGEVDTSGLTLLQRQNRIIAKIRSMGSLAMWTILTTVVSYLPPGVFAQVVDLNCDVSGKSWILGVSRLSISTVLGWGDHIVLNNPNGLDLCDLIHNGKGWKLSASRLSVDTQLTGDNSWQDISTLQAKAYTYEVRIFDYTLSGVGFDRMVRDITRLEPARSAHLIRQNLSLVGYGLTVPVANVSQASGVNCITVDSSQATGYSGRVTVYG